jgi:ankyrin repeat protein
MGHLEIVNFLLQRGCDPNATTVRGETSLHLATRGNQTAVMKVLLRNGAQVDAKAKVSILQENLCNCTDKCAKIRQ